VTAASAPALRRHRSDWEDLAELDPEWAIASTPGSRYGGWDEDAFLERGERAVAKVMAAGERLARPVGRASALDFGCGLGRLTRALAARFGEVVGVDISERMITGARRLHESVPNASFIVNAEPHLEVFPSDRFDLVYAKLVLGHQPTVAVALDYVGELVRVLRPGGLLAFGAPSKLALRNRIQAQRRLYGVLRRLGMPRDFLYRRLRLHPIRLIAIPEDRVGTVLRATGATLLEVERLPAGAGVNATYYATK
jgi:SAM-dependent methyltransferase